LASTEWARAQLLPSVIAALEFALLHSESLTNMDSKLAIRTEILADNSMSVAFERNRLKDLGYVVLKCVALSPQLINNLLLAQSQLWNSRSNHTEEFDEAEREFANFGSSTQQGRANWSFVSTWQRNHFCHVQQLTSSLSNVQDDENKLIELQIKVDKLEALLADKSDEDARQILLGKASSRANQNKMVRFSDDTEVNPQELENGQILQLQTRMMDGNVYPKKSCKLACYMYLNAWILQIKIVIWICSLKLWVDRES
jgi:hypothetical protein